MFNRKEVLGYLLAVKGAGLAQVGALLTGITEINRFHWVNPVLWGLVILGLFILAYGLWLAAQNESHTS